MVHTVFPKVLFFWPESYLVFNVRRSTPKQAIHFLEFHLKKIVVSQQAISYQIGALVDRI